MISADLTSLEMTYLRGYDTYMFCWTYNAGETMEAVLDEFTEIFGRLCMETRPVVVNLEWQWYVYLYFLTLICIFLMHVGSNYVITFVLHCVVLYNDIN